MNTVVVLSQTTPGIIELISAGPQGPVGASSTVAGPQGPQGPQGLQGIQGPAGSGGGSAEFAEQSPIVTVSYTVPTGKTAFRFESWSINTLGIEVTVPAGAKLVTF